MRLGEYLIAKGTLSEDELRKALNYQLIYGAHLGTCLIELEYLEEDVLGGLLSEMLGVSYVQSEMLEEIQPHVIAKLPQSVVERRRVIPFDIKNKVLHVAMVDPRNLIALDEISFVSGCRIEPWLCPEVRILQAMERYYDVQRKTRYITLATELDERRAQKERKAKQAAVLAVGLGETGAILQETPAAKHRASESQRPPDRGRTISGDEELVEVSDELCRAESKEHVARAILDGIPSRTGCIILFWVKDNAAVVWDSKGWPVAAGRKRSIALPLTSEPVFDLLMGEPHYRGPVRHDPRCLRFYEIIEMKAPAEILLIPVRLEDRIVALLYVDGGPEAPIEASTETFERLMRKLSLALSLLIIKGKIRAA